MALTWPRHCWDWHGFRVLEVADAGAELVIDVEKAVPTSWDVRPAASGRRQRTG